MDGTELIGSVAGTLTTAAFLPQAIKTWHSRSTRDISLLMFTVLCAGLLMWIVYGVLKESWPVIIANVVTLMLAGFILVLKIRATLREK